MKPIVLLKRWHFRTDRMQNAYYIAARRCGKYHMWLGIPAVLLSTIVGTSMFASLAKLPIEPSIQLWVQIATGLLSVAAAALAGLQTFLKYSEQAERHRVAGAKFANLKHRIELLLAFPSAMPEPLRTQLAAIEDEWNRIRQDSPNLPDRLWRKIEGYFEPEDFHDSEHTAANA